MRRRLMEIQPIGRVRQLSDAESVIELAPEHLDGLHGVRAGDRVQILYWMHKLGRAERKLLQVHPRGDRRRSLKGVFGLRSPMRPNPIGVTVVEVVGIDGAGLFVKGLDALDGSPVIDVKGARNMSGG